MTHDFARNAELEQLIDDLRHEFKLPAVSWAVAPLDGPIIAGAGGVRCLGKPGRVSVHDRMHLGSCTKPMTATMLATLVPHALQWTTRVADVFGAERVHPAYQRVTLEQLLAHVSGLPPFTQDEHFHDAPTDGDSHRMRRKAFALYALQQPPQWKTGEYGYSNAGYGVAAAMVELATEEAWEDLMRTRVFQGLAIDSAGFGWPGRRADPQPWGHWHPHGTLVPHDPHDDYQLHAGIAPAGDIHMNVLDFATFARDHLRGLAGRSALLEPSSYERLHTPLLDGGDSGLGWGVSRYGERRASSHSGSAQTFRAIVLVLPDEGHAVVVATNAGGEREKVGVMHVLKILAARFTEANVDTD